MIMENIPRSLVASLYATGSDLCTARMGGLVTRTGGLSRRAAYPLFAIRRQVLDRLQQAGPAWIQGNLRGAGRRWYSSN